MRCESEALTMPRSQKYDEVEFPWGRGRGAGYEGTREVGRKRARELRGVEHIR